MLLWCQALQRNNGCRLQDAWHCGSLLRLCRGAAEASCMLQQAVRATPSCQLSLAWGNQGCTSSWCRCCCSTLTASEALPMQHLSTCHSQRGRHRLHSSSNRRMLRSSRLGLSCPWACPKAVMVEVIALQDARDMQLKANCACPGQAMLD